MGAHPPFFTAPPPPAAELQQELELELELELPPPPPRFLPPIALHPPHPSSSFFLHHDDFSTIFSDSRSDKSLSAASEKNFDASGRDFSSGSSVGESPAPRLKFMCSFGGTILPRPGDGKLRYAGGDTKIVSVHRHISYADLMRKMRQIYGEAVLLKYQLPDEDLDALISVSSDEDLENMMEEYMRLEASQGPSRLRIFLFPPPDYHQNESAAGQTNADQIYVDAINGMSVAGGLKGNSDIAVISSSKNSRGLEVLEAWNASQTFGNASDAPVPQRSAAPVLMLPLNQQVLPRISLRSPSSPPISPVPTQLSQVGQCAIPDLSLNFYPEQLTKTAVRQYEPRLDEIHHDVEGIGSASSSAQQSALDFMQAQQRAQYRYQQIASQHYAPTDKSAREVSAFKQLEQSVQQHDALNGQLPYKSMAVQTSQNQSGSKAIPVPGSQLGSAPPSPRVAHWENNMNSQQLLPALQGAVGGFVDRPYGKMTMQPHVEPANSVLKPANTPPDGREQLPYTEDQITFQQKPMPFRNLENLSKGKKGDPLHRKHEALHSEVYNLDRIPQMTPPYPGVTIYQDSLTSFSNCEMLRGDKFAENSCYEDEVDAIVQNAHNCGGETIGEWAHVRKSDMKELMISDFFPSGIAETLLVNAPAPCISETSVVSGAAGDTYLTAQNTRCPLVNTLVHSRVTLVPSTVAARHVPDPGRTLFSDCSQAEGDIWATQATMRAGTKILDTLTIPSSFKETPSVSPLSIATDGNSDTKLACFTLVQTGSPMSAFPPSQTLSSASRTESAFLAKLEEGRWTEDSESDSRNSGVHLDEVAHDSSGYLVQDDELSRPASGYIGADPNDTLGILEVIVSKSTSNKNLLDDTFVPLYSQAQTVISNGTSYGVGLGASTMSLGIFPTGITLSPQASTTAATGSSVTSPCLSPMVEIPASSTCLSRAFKDSSCDNTLSTKRKDMVDSAHMKEEVPIPDFGVFGTFGVFPVQASQGSGFEEKELSPRFGSSYIQESGKHEDEDEGIQGELEHVANNVVAAVFEPSLHSSPTLSMQNWENALANVELEEQATEDSMPVDKSLDEMKVHIVENEVTFQDAKIGSKEVDSDGLSNNKSMNLAAIAEAEAISRGLQTIKNLDLEELRELGSGTFGTVYHGKWRGTDVAIKRIKSSCFNGRPSERERLIADFWKEACILGQLHHPNVVAFYGVVPDGPGETLATVTEYMVNGSLKQVLQRKDRTIDRRKRLLIIMDAAFGMEYLHEKNIVHFDLKCENLLVNMKDAHRPICKVGDLGLSKVKHQTMVSGGVRGTLPWMAPELLNGSSSLVSEKVDVFSFGIVMWELLTGEEPYANMHYGAIIGGIVNNTLRPPVPSWCEPSWKLLMERCWSADLGERPSFSNIASELRAMATLASSKAA